MLSLLVPLLLTAPDAGVLTSRPVSISAEKLEVFKKENRALYTGHAKAVRDTLTLTCDRLEVFFTPSSDVQRIVAQGNVYAIDGDRELWGDEADFVNETGVLTVRGKPHGKQGVREIDGELATFTTGIDRLVVTKAKTRVLTERSRPDGTSGQPVPERSGGLGQGEATRKTERVFIDADLLTLEGEKNVAKWSGHVRAVKGKTTLLAPEVTAHYDAQGEIDRVLARGGVEVTEGDRWARGQNADYAVPTGMLVVTGKPQARQGKTRMKGTKVTFFSGTEFLEVENATTVIEVDKKKVK